MANTYSQIYMHLVFAVAHREAMIADSWVDELYAYLAGICKSRKHLALAIGGMADHVHMLVAMHPAESVAELMKNLKGQSSHWINEKYCHGAFAWQSGYGAFSYNGSLLPVVKQYIANQREHHRHIPFAEEVERMFRKAGIEYDPQYMMYGLVSPTEGVS